MAYQVIVLMGQQVCVCGCEACEHVWISAWRSRSGSPAAVELPTRCARCKSMRWNQALRGAQSAADSLENLRRDNIALSQSLPRERVTVSAEYARSLAKQLKREPILDKSGDYTQE